MDLKDLLDHYKAQLQVATGDNIAALKEMIAKTERAIAQEEPAEEVTAPKTRRKTARR